MATAPRTLNHPTFGACVLVPSLVAIRWSAPVDDEAVTSALSDLGVSPAAEAPPTARKKSTATRDPAVSAVNHTTTLTWAKCGRTNESSLARMAAHDAVEWVSPAYRATQSDRGPQSYFTINPTCLLLTAQATEAVGGPFSPGDAAGIFKARSNRTDVSRATPMGACSVKECAL